MIKNTQVNLSESLIDESRQQKKSEWQIEFAEYIRVSNQLASENGSALEEWRTF